MIQGIINLIEAACAFLWGDLITLPLPGGGTLGISLLVMLLIPTGIYFTIRTRVLPIRLFRDEVDTVLKQTHHRDGLSSFQSLMISTATRVGMGNLVGVVAAVSAGGAGAVFWMWISALLGSSTAFVEATLAQLHQTKDPLYGGYRGGPAYYIHDYFEKKKGHPIRYSVIAFLFALSGLICWCGISQVISNSVTSSFQNAFGIPPLYTTIVLVLFSAIIVLRKNLTVPVLDIIVPFMATCYFGITVALILINITAIPDVLSRIFSEAFGFQQVAAGGFGDATGTIKPGIYPGSAALSAPGGGLTIASGLTPGQEAMALEFVKYMTSDEVQEKIFLEVNANPCNTDIDLIALAESSDSETVALLAEACSLANAANNVFKTTGAVWGEDVNNAIVNKLIECSVEGTDIDAKCEELQAELAALIG